MYLNLFLDDSSHSHDRLKYLKHEVTLTFQSDAFNSFVSEFNRNVPTDGINLQTLENDKTLKAVIEKLKEWLAHVNVEKAQVNSKYEKPTTICHS